MFSLPSSWVWDFWLADDGEQHHLFFLYASRALKDPEARHYRASIGHAVSSDLMNWTRVEDALVRSDAPAFDDLATWTGSIVRASDGSWRMFYTGSTLADDGVKNIQSIGVAASPDLFTWTKSPANPLLTADGRWYETLSDDWHDEAFRDPWVFADRSGNGWHMLITARAPGASDPFGRGVVGHATSTDLDTWQLQPPLSDPAAGGFGQLEVMQTEIVDGRAVLIFSCLAEHASEVRRAQTGGIWAAPATSLTGTFDIDASYPLTDNRLYSGRLTRDRDDNWVMLAFRLADANTPFVGSITDPMPVRWAGSQLVVAEPAGVPSGSRRLAGTRTAGVQPV